MKRRLFSIICVWLVVSSLAGAASITVAPDGHYFQRGDKAFLIIGPNDAITWPGISPLLGNASLDAVDAYLGKMAEKGVNTLRIMLEYAQTPVGLIEDPIGHFRDEVVQLWDALFSLLEKHGLYAIVTPWDPFWMQRNWASNPYNVNNGGMMESMYGFLTDPEAITAQKNRFRFMVERWGGSEAILAWELMNEIELWWGANPYAIYDWIDMMADFVREVQQEVHGRTSLITVSTATSMPSGALADVIFNHPKLDFASTHLYTGPGMNAPFNTTDVVEEVAWAVLYATYMIKDNRPYTDTESGPIDMWIGSAKFDAEYLHNVSWSHLANGGAGTGMRWPYRTPHILTDEMMDVLGRIALFAEEFDFTGFAPESINASLTTEPNHFVYGIADEERALIWLVREDHGTRATESATITWEGFGRGESCEVCFWDTWQASWIVHQSVDTSAELKITTPPFAKDITIVIRKMDSNK